MGAFLATGRIDQTADGKVENFVDTSNYTDNTDGVTLNNIQGRVLTSYLSDGSVFLTQVFGATSLTVPVPVVKDLALSHVLVVTLSNASTRTGTVNYLSTRFYDIIQRQKANDLNCKCASNKSLCSNMSKAMAFADAAVSFNDIGDRVSAQEQIDAANLYVNQKSDCGC